MGPEVSNFETGTGGFADTTEPLPTFEQHMNDLNRQNLEAPPNGESGPVGESNPANIPPTGDLDKTGGLNQASESNQTSEQDSTDTQGEQAQGDQTQDEQIQNSQNQIGETNQISQAPEISPNPAPSVTPEATKATDTANTAESATTESTAETTADFSPKELEDIRKYADKLEAGIEDDQEIVRLLRQFIDAASHQRSAVHQPATSNTANAVVETPPPATPGTTETSTATNQPAATPKPLDIAAAIAEAIKEPDIPVPGQATIVTPAAPPTGEFPLTA